VQGKNPLPLARKSEGTPSGAKNEQGSDFSLAFHRSSCRNSVRRRLLLRHYWRIRSFGFDRGPSVVRRAGSIHLPASPGSGDTAMNLDPALLARIQFGFTVSFHIIFPTISIGLAMFLAITEGLWLKTKDPLYLQIYRFWLGIFAMAFGVGVVTGIVLSFEFGLGFAKFSQIAGPAIGPMIGLEVLTSFFLEAGFLGIMLFGLRRVGPRLHFFATCMVALGTLLSASWILSANSWMQTPDGVAVRGGRLVVINWWHVVNNPSWLVRLPHMLSAAYLTPSFLVAGVGSWYLLQGRHLAFAKKSVALGTAFATVLIAGQVFIGDILYGTMLAHQPSTMQAAEGFWEKESASPAPYYWVILPDQKQQRNRFALGVPYLGSIWLTHSLHGRVEGLKNTPAEQQPI